MRLGAVFPRVTRRLGLRLFQGSRISGVKLGFRLVEPRSKIRKIRPTGVTGGATIRGNNGGPQPGDTIFPRDTGLFLNEELL